jgi:hypothetical protein
MGTDGCNMETASEQMETRPVFQGIWTPARAVRNAAKGLTLSDLDRYHFDAVTRSPTRLIW